MSATKQRRTDKGGGVTKLNDGTSAASADGSTDAVLVC